MKKLITVLIAVLIVFCPVCAFAGEAHVNHVPGSTGIEVYGSYQKIKDYYEITLGVPGLDTVQLPGGVVLSGSNKHKADTNMRIIIVPVTAKEEPDAYKWLTGNLSKNDKASTAYYLGFYDNDDNHTQPAGDVTITLTIQKGYENTKLYYMDTNGQLKQLHYSAASDSAKFTISATGYYLFLKPAGDSNKPDPAVPDNNNNGSDINSPKTGDSSNLSLWLALFITSSVTLILALLLALRNKRKHI